MTLSIVGLGTASASLAAGYVAGAATDEIFTVVAAKPHSITDPSNAGYTAIGSCTSGSVASGMDVGSVKVAAFWKIGASATGTGTNTFTATGAGVSLTQTVRVATDAAPILVSTGVALTDTNEAGTTVSATGTATSDQIRAGDMLLLCATIEGDSIVHASQSVTVAGCTLGTVTWAKSQTSNGDDLGIYVGYCQVTAGSSTGTVTYAATSDTSGASATAVEVVVVRDSTPQPISGTTAVTSGTSGAVARSAVSGTVAVTSGTSGQVAPAPSGPTDLFTDVFTDDKSAGAVEETSLGVIGYEMVLVNPGGRDTVPAFPGGLGGVARCIGWEMNLSANTITPILSMDGEL